MTGSIARVAWLCLCVLVLMATSAKSQEQETITTYGFIVDPEPLARQVTGCPVEQELAANFRWLHDDAARSSTSAAMRHNILRAISVTFEGDVARIREAYKKGQAHRNDVAALVDTCDDAHVRRMAYDTFAEAHVRLKSCSASSPAGSATCHDVSENLRWSLMESGNCAPYAREWLSRAMNKLEYLKTRAEWVRRGLQAAQGHRPDIAASVDFVSDQLLVQLAETVYQNTNAAKLDRRYGDPKNPIARNACPGILLFDKYE